MKPILPLEWEPSKVSYLAWQEMHSRAHAIQDTTLVSVLTNNNITTINNARSVAISNLEDSSADELTIINLPAAVVASAPATPVLNLDEGAAEDIPLIYLTQVSFPASVAAVPVLTLEESVADELTVLYLTALSPASSVAAQPVLNLEDAAQEDLLASYPSQLLSSTGIIALPASPLSSTQTQAFTGLSNKKTSDSTSGSATLTADAALTVTCNETGYYQIEIFLAFYEAVLGTGGFQFDLNAGSATLGAILFGSDGFTTAAIANSAATSAATATQYNTVATSSSAPSWTYLTGAVQVTAAGTFGVRWAQNTVSVNLTTLKALSYITLTKIG
jgi:hypothetical protein